MSDEVRVNALVDELLASCSPATTSTVEFLRKQFDLGLAWVHFDEGFGGLGLAPRLQGVINRRIAAAGGPNAWPRNPIGIGMTAPTVHTWGSEDQKRRYLRPLFSGEEIWCQLFSEPGAGSDVASLATSAVRDGDEWVLNGQKVWTSLGHLARYGVVVARTNPNVPKHAGLSYFVIDMKAPGVEARGLRQMTGDAEFNEIYFTDVRIPDSERLGAVGDGWRVSLTTLMNERVSIGGSTADRGGPIDEALELWVKASSHLKDPSRRDALMKLYTESEVLRFTVRRASAGQARGIPGPEGSVAKLISAEHNKRTYAFCMELMGADATLYDTYVFDRNDRDRERDVRYSFLRSRANSIEGGTSEIMRNILGERMLGLPGDIRVDKELPWTDVPRN